MQTTITEPQKLQQKKTPGLPMFIFNQNCSSSRTKNIQFFWHPFFMNETFCLPFFSMQFSDEQTYWSRIDHSEFIKLMTSFTLVQRTVTTADITIVSQAKPTAHAMDDAFRTPSNWKLFVSKHGKWEFLFSLNPFFLAVQTVSVFFVCSLRAKLFI